jgi:hypothetical protein
MTDEMMNLRALMEKSADAEVVGAPMPQDAIEQDSHRLNPRSSESPACSGHLSIRSPGRGIDAPGPHGRPRFPAVLKAAHEIVVSLLA